MVAVSAPTIGVLAYQGDVREHVRMLERLDVPAPLVRTPAQLDAVDGLVIPGGESGVIDRLARQFGTHEQLRHRIAAGFPVLGTCAGLIMLADRIDGAVAGQHPFGGIDVTVRRNAFGSQLDSFETQLAVDGVAEDVWAVFIRGPIVSEVGPGAAVVARLADGRVVGVRQGNLLGYAFHPELTEDARIHEHFVALAAAARR